MNLPKVTFTVESSSLRQGAEHLVGRVVLQATATDAQLWEDIVELLEGHTVSTVETFKDALISTLKADLSEAEEAAARELRELRDRVSVLSAQLARYEHAQLEQTRLAQALQPPQLEADAVYSAHDHKHLG